jgi:hypothetical protein
LFGLFIVTYEIVAKNLLEVFELEPIIIDFGTKPLKLLVAEQQLLGIGTLGAELLDLFLDSLVFVVGAHGIAQCIAYGLEFVTGLTDLR